MSTNWTDINTMPKKGMLVAYELASSGWVNGVVSGFTIKRQDGRVIVMVDMGGNARMLEDLRLPVSPRETMLLSLLKSISDDTRHRSREIIRNHM